MAASNFLLAKLLANSRPTLRVEEKVKPVCSQMEKPLYVASASALNHLPNKISPHGERTQV